MVERTESWSGWVFLQTRAVRDLFARCLARWDNFDHDAARHGPIVSEPILEGHVMIIMLT